MIPEIQFPIYEGLKLYRIFMVALDYGDGLLKPMEQAKILAFSKEHAIKILNINTETKGCKNYRNEDLEVKEFDLKPGII